MGGSKNSLNLRQMMEAIRTNRLDRLQRHLSDLNRRRAERATLVPLLIEALGDIDKEVRLCALLAIGAAELHYEITLEKLYRISLDDPCPRVRVAAGSLSLSGNQAAVMKDLVAYDDGQPEFRWAVAMAMGVEGPVLEEAIPTLIEALQGRRRWNAQRQLALIGEPSIEPLVDCLRQANREVKALAAETLAMMGAAATAAVPALVEVAQAEFSDPIRRERRTIVIDAEAESAIDEPPDDPFIFGTILKALGWIGPGATLAFPTLEAMLPYLDMPQLDSALISIGPHLPDAISRVEAMLNHQLDGVRTVGAKIAKRLGTGAAGLVPRLVNCLTCEWPEARLAAAEAIAETGPDARVAASALAAALDDHDLRVTKAAAVVLGRIGTGARDFLPALTSAQARVRDQHDVRAAIMEAILAIGVEPEWGLDGIEVLGDRPLLIRDALERFCQIGQICRDRNSDRFSFKKMSPLVGETESTLRSRIKDVSKLFCHYFSDIENIITAEDDDLTVDLTCKIFQRAARMPVTICRPLGWRAWELSCRFLERLGRVAKASQHPKR